MPARDAAVVSILAYAGMRPAEARALTPSHLGQPHLHLTEQAGRDGALKAMKSTELQAIGAGSARPRRLTWRPSIGVTAFLLKNVDGGRLETDGLGQLAAVEGSHRPCKAARVPRSRTPTSSPQRWRHCGIGRGSTRPRSPGLARPRFTELEGDVHAAFQVA